MKTPIAKPHRHRPSSANAPTRRACTQRATPREPAPALPPPDHDFLVPNPRPDLVTDAQTCRMLERAAP